MLPLLPSLPVSSPLFPSPPLSSPLLPSPPPSLSELVACQVEVTFPHDYFFAETFEKVLIACCCMCHGPSHVRPLVFPPSPLSPLPSLPTLPLQLQAARKFLLDLHSKGEGEKSALGVLVPLDVYLRADSFSFQLQDNRFEASLKSNHMVRSGWVSVDGQLVQCVPSSGCSC